MKRYSKQTREMQKRAQIGICPGCLKPLGTEYHGHAPFAGSHDSPFGGVAVHPECHKKTPTYGAGQKGLLDYFYKP